VRPSPPPSARRLASAPQPPHTPPVPCLARYARHQAVAPRRSTLNAAAAPGVASEARCFEEILLECNNINGMAHALWARLVRPGDVCVDTTAGNGIDTVALARLGPARVLALDVQQAALDVARLRLDAELTPEQAARVELKLCCHSRLGELVAPATAAVVAFNLGFLPVRGGGGPTPAEPPAPRLSTQPATTLPALAAAATALRSGGVISVMIYTGHPGGLEEAAAVDAFAAALPTGEWTATSIALTNRAACPRLLLLYKRERPTTKGR
jgi:hypothetical protein